MPRTFHCNMMGPRSRETSGNNKRFLWRKAMQRPISICIAVTLTTGLIPSTSGANEQGCRLRPPESVEAALLSRPIKVDGTVPYEEQVQHPAFDEVVTNSGVLYVSQNDTLIKRQMAPVFEELEIGSEFLIVRRANKTARHPIPDRLSIFLSVLRSIILATSEKIDPSYSKQFDVNSNGWSVALNASSKKKETIVLLGCGAVLEAIHISTKNGQRRRLRLLGQ